MIFFPPQGKVTFLRNLLLAAALPLAVFFCGLVRASETNSIPASAEDVAWRGLQHLRQTPPEELRQPSDHMLTDVEIREHYARVAAQAGGVADAARGFYQQFPESTNAARAREIYFNSVHTAVENSSRERIAELETATSERLKNPRLDEAERFQLSLRLLHSTVSGRQYEGDDAMRAELEKRALQLAANFPGHPDGVNYLLNIARVAEPQKAASVAREILALTADEKTANECRGLINRAGAEGQPLDLKLPLDDGKTLDLAQLRGKVVCLFFWDVQSKFSPKAMNVVNNLYKTFHPQGVDFFGLNFDEKPEKAKAFLKENNIEWPQYSDHASGGKILRQYGMYWLPTLWLVDKKGVLRELKAEHGPTPLIKKLLAE